MAEISKGKNIGLWIVQGLLAAGFIFSGVMKFLVPVEMLTAGTPYLSAGFMYFIGIAEILGGLGLVLPQATGIKQWLTPLAAVLLGVIMIGAVVVCLITGQAAMAPVPAVFGILCAVVAWGRK